MATTVTGTKPLTQTGLGGGSRSRGPNGNGSPKRNGHGHAFFDARSSANRYRIGMWVGMASILMLFTGLSSAYIVRAASANDWQPLRMPGVLLLSTALIIISSITLEFAQRKLKNAAQSAHKSLLAVTTLLGFGFLASQVFAWNQLAQQGIYISSNPHSSFFYLLTATHAVHLLGGLAGLMFLTLRSRLRIDDELAAAKGQAQTDAVTLYWHFMDVLWIYLFLLLFFWRQV
ncbi:MAG: cytochrome c oxidase subunit 3 [Pyrinomonadaceae bacterium]